MCDVADHLLEHPSSPSPSTSASRQRQPEATKGHCIKCKSAKATLAVRQSVYCQPCFLLAHDLKFQQTLRKLITEIGETRPVLLHVTGNMASVVLVELLAKRMRLAPPLFPQITLVYLDPSGIAPSSEDPFEHLQKCFAPFPFPFLRIPLSEVFQQPTLKKLLTVLNKDSTLPLDPPASSPEAFENFLQQYTSALTRGSVVEALKLHSLLSLAKSHQSDLIVCDTLFTLASKSLKATVTARGDALPDALASTQVYPLYQVRVLRPLATFTLKELALYMHFSKLEYAPPVTSMHSPMDLQIESFLLAMERYEQRGILTTLYRTSLKLSSHVSGPCLFCLLGQAQCLRTQLCGYCLRLFGLPAAAR